MKLSTTFRNFIYSQQVNEGVRVTIGILIPALLFAWYGQLTTGVSLALGAMCCSITDGPGPIHHRRNGMVATIVALLFVALSGGVAASSPVIFGAVIVLYSFVFSMFAVYGARAGAVGIAALIIMVLDMQQQRPLSGVVMHALLIASGGLWYMCLSMLLHKVKPYKPVQQALGECIQTIATYLHIRASFYRKTVNYDTTYRQVIQQQGIIQERLTIAGELLFKTRDIVKETTPIGRVLVMIYMDINDMFEQIMTSYQDYAILHNHFDGLDILERFGSIANELATQMELVGIAVKSGSAYEGDCEGVTDLHLEETRNHLDALRETHLNQHNLQEFMSLRRILENLREINDRLKTLQQYTTYDAVLHRKKVPIDYTRFIAHQPITPGVLLNAFTLKSEVFRHSLRLSITMLLGYLVSLFFPIGHGYWILLTIVVIVKPAYSLSKSRNRDRLAGTIIGVIIGMAIVYLIDDRNVLLAIMIFFMLGTYTFFRSHYLTSVIMMTPYIIIFFHFLNPGGFRAVLLDRVVDTFIASVIAFFSSLILFPAWERHKIKPLMEVMLTQARLYFDTVAAALAGTVELQRQKLARKEAFVALGNLSDALNRMLAEPKRKQHGINDIHQFVVLCHMLLSHIATLSSLALHNPGIYQSPQYTLVAKDIQLLLSQIEDTLTGNAAMANVPAKENLRSLNQQVNVLLKKRQEEIRESFSDTETKKRLIEVKSLADQFNFIFNVGNDLAKTAKAVATVV